MIQDFKIKARDLPYSTKRDIIKSYIGKENIFHNELKILLENIYPTAYVEILQGAEEKGKDIVVRIQDNFGNYEHIAFVVKALEKLTGSASGKTGELVIQIQQAFKTKAQLKDIHDEVSISKVYVVNTGTISDGAKRKILTLIDETNYRNNVYYFAIENLIQLFEEHYPEFYFNKDMQLFFKERVEKIEKFLIEDKELKNFIQPHIKRFEKTKKELLAQQSAQNDLQVISEQLFGHKETFQSFSSLIIDKKSQRIILTGEAGSGKSVLLFKIILEFINKFLKENNIQSIAEQEEFSLPICLKAIDLKNENLNNFEEIVESFYSNSKDNKIKTIIIDGIDEVSAECRKNIKNKVEAYVALKNINISIVFSSRTNFSIIDSFDEYIHYELMPYETKQAIEFIKNMVKEQSILVTNLEKSLKELEGQIPFYPLALRLLVKVVEEHKEIPASITELYIRYIDILFGKHEITAEIDKLFDPTIKEEFFSYLAYHVFFSNNKVKVNLDEFKSFVDDFSKTHSFINKEEFIKDIYRISILKVEDEDVYFSHKSFLDFFIAIYFKNNKDDLEDEDEFDKLFNLYSFVEQWEEVVFFYFGLKKKINKREFKKLNKSINTLENDFERNLNIFYLGRLSQYAYMTDDKYKEEIILNAMKISLKLKDNFHEMFKGNFEIEIPKILSSISIFQMIDFCYSSSFLRNKINKLIENINNETDENELYFATLYILKNSHSLDKKFINNNLRKLVPLIQKIEDLENRVLLTILIDFFDGKGRIELDDDLNKSINKLVKKYQKTFPEVFQRVLSVKKSGFKNLRNRLEKR